MTDDQVEDLADAAIELLSESDAMDPAKAEKVQSLDFLRSIEYWAETSIAALEAEIAKESR